ncbi:hypothetical protein L7F22_065166 [Adiantum nelumboides]|nr:hypothetical protein [Adiantum nelumboides]
MVFPNFHGRKGENASNFLDDLEMAFLVSGRDNAKIKLRAFPLVLREEAKVWFQGLDEGRQGDWEVLKRAFLQRFHDDNNPEEIWRRLSQLQQASPNAYPAYEARFLKLWTQWEQILPEGERAPNFLQKERFLAGLASVLREKVKCKFPDSFEDALTWARLKDRKLQFQRYMLDQSQAAAAGTTSQEQAPPPPPNESGDPHLDLLQRNKDPRVAIKQIPLDFEQFLSRSPSQWCVHEGRVEEMITFVTPRSYTIAIADALYGFCAPNSVNDDVKDGVSAYKKLLRLLEKIKPNIHGYKLDRFSWACEFATIGFYSSLGVQNKGSYNFAVKPDRTNVIERPGVCKKFKHIDADLHGVINPYQKPQLLMMDLIDLLSMRGEWVMDLFAGTGTTTVSALKRGQNVIAMECDPLQVKFIEQQVTALKELPDEFQEVGMKSMTSDPCFFDAFGEPQPIIGSEKVGKIVDLVDFEPDNVEVKEQASDTPLQITSMGEETRNEEEEDLPIQA